jgi:gliding motility-associated-like protein
VKYTAADATGNQVVCEFDVTVKVVDIPVFTYCPENIQVKSNEYGEAVVDWAVPTATTACSAVPLTLTSSHQPGDIFPIGTTTVKYKAEDPFGNAGYCEFQVQVQQTEIDINVSPLVTPDGNAQNDEWIVTNIENFKDNKVVIVDRWGSVIYTASGYNNQSVVWNGSNRQGSVVPTGTYFYTISVRYGPAVFEKTGFIELIR